MSSYFSISPAPWFIKMQKEDPVSFDEEFTLASGQKGAWHIVRYKDVQYVLRQHSLFSNMVLPPVTPFSQSFYQTDPPRHTLLRSLVTKAFASSYMTRMKGWIEDIATELLQPLLECNEVEFINKFVIPFQIRALSYILGMPTGHEERLHGWMTTMLSNPSISGDPDAFVNSQADFKAFIIQTLEEKKKHPAEDLLTHLLNVEIDGQQLSMDDLVPTVVLLLVAGSDETGMLVANTMSLLIELPDWQFHLQQHPEDIERAINEVLRYRSPSQGVWRIATEDTELGGKLIKKGDLLNVWLSAANFDPEVFPDPEHFDIYRDNYAQLMTFGSGIHHCFGYALSKLEGKIAIEVILKHLYDIDIKQGTVLTRLPSTIFYGLEALPIVYKVRR